ncbi:AAA family ATPase [Capilliphycus salinus ALCB114379]|uniref:AAA family ATPase n=1 Tax=Capilliphycus salinus TaxID=2768948 RepID=UPI0039A5B922
MSKLILMIGLPGSGKSFFARQLSAKHPKYKLISTDSIRAQLFGNEAIQGPWLRVWSQVLQQFQQAVEEGTDAIYDATNTQRRQRKDVITIARKIGFHPIFAVWVNIPLEICLQRNQNRPRQVPEEIILKMHRQLTDVPPSLQEPLDSLIIL